MDRWHVADAAKEPPAESPESMHEESPESMHDESPEESPEPMHEISLWPRVSPPPPSEAGVVVFAHATSSAVAAARLQNMAKETAYILAAHGLPFHRLQGQIAQPSTTFMHEQPSTFMHETDAYLPALAFPLPPSAPTQSARVGINFHQLQGPCLDMFICETYAHCEICMHTLVQENSQDDFFQTFLDNTEVAMAIVRG